MSGAEHASAATDVDGAAAPTTPPQPAPGERGGKGPCGSSSIEAKNEAWPEQTVWVFEPTGDVAARTGGRGDDHRRPAVFMTPGWTVHGDQSEPACYRAVIENLVSHGNIVVYANYLGDYYDTQPETEAPKVYDQVDDAFAQAASMTDRMNLADIAIWGHSFGGGMVPWLAQRAVARGWGSASLWLAVYTPYHARRVGEPGEPVELPEHTRALIQAYDRDAISPIVDVAAPDIFHRLTIPRAHKRHITITSDTRGDDDNWALIANHFTPAAWPTENHLSYYGMYRNLDVLSDCARRDLPFDVDLSTMGTWSDGRPASPAIVTDDP